MDMLAHVMLFKMVFCLALGFFTSWGMISLILKWIKSRSVAGGVRDFHHTHKTPVPRFGGVALAFSFAVIALVIYFFGFLPDARTNLLAVIVLTSLAMFALGLWDDIRPLPARFKLLGQIAIAALAYDGNVRIEIFKSPLTDTNLDLGVFSFLVTVLWLVTLTNLINLIDGIDGLAAGICLMLMFLLANLGVGDEMAVSVLLSVGAGGALLGFLKFNYPPAKIYMGDGGAYFLGFLIGLLAIVSSNKGTVAAALLAPAFALALPIVDVSLAVLRRALCGLPIFRPDRKHIHHHLLTLGISTERALLNLYTVSLLCLFLAVGVFYLQGRMLPLYCGLLFLVLLVAGHLSGFTRDWFTVSSQLGKSLALRRETQYALTLSRWLVMEVEKHNRAKELWQDYQFVVKKIGFCKIRVILPNGLTGNWEMDGLGANIKDHWHAVHDMSDGTAIEFYADKAKMQESHFQLMGDLATEMWYKIATKWMARQGMPLDFVSEATVSTPETESVAAPVMPAKVSSGKETLQGKEVLAGL